MSQIDFPIPKKANTTSSIFITSTITVPNMRSIINAMSILLCQQIKEDYAGLIKIPQSSPLYIFDEEKLILEKPEEFSQKRIDVLRQKPTAQSISEFINAIYSIAEFSHQCCIISLIYLFRLKRMTNIPLCATTWRPLLFTSMLIAQKVYDDTCLKNSDFLQIYPFFTKEEINQLESQYLYSIRFDCNVDFRIYAKYFYELRSTVGGEEEFPERPINVEQGEQLEIQSKRYIEQFQLNQQFQKSTSLNINSPSRRRSIAILN